MVTATRNTPLWWNLSKISVHLNMRKDCFKRAHQFKDFVYNSRNKEIKALLEWIKQKFWLEGGKKWARLCSHRDGSIQRNPSRNRDREQVFAMLELQARCSRALVSSLLRLSLHYRGRSLAECIQWSSAEQKLICCFPLDVKQGSPSLISFSPFPPQGTPFHQHIICKPCCKDLAFIIHFLGEKKSRRLPHVKELCYSTNELPLLFSLSHLWDSVEHYWSGVLVCRLGHMTEDIFFCYNAKEASERDKQKILLK